MPVQFDAAFEGLTGYAPFDWQRRLFNEIGAGKRYDRCDIPTGLGKTSIIPIWLIALAAEGERAAQASDMVRIPRRLVYVVDRRTVVDQATDITVKIRKQLMKKDGPAIQAVSAGLEALSGDSPKPLAISTLRGELADNKEWQDDPARAAIIIGTVDMIGSRLTFSAYGASRKMRPFHAGLIGHDTLIVHDEAHLSPAFDKLISNIARLQKNASEPRPIQVMALSATQRDSEAGFENVFSLTESEKAQELVAKRLNAAKTLRWRKLEKGEALEQALSAAALSYDSSKARVVIYVRSPKTAANVASILEKNGKPVATLTGTIRGHERDEMTSGEPEKITDETAKRRAKIFQGFRAKAEREEPEQTEYLIATSAGEVGVDLDADHMGCDPTTLDSMIQRLGRVNRLGEGAADVVIVESSVEEGDDDEPLSDLETRIAATRKALEALTEIDGARDASPQALRNLVEGTPTDEREACFSKRPTMMELTDILLDGWAMTSVEDLPGRPPVERWLHGVAAQQPSLYVAWREEVDEFVESGDRKALKTLFDKHPILARERLRGNLRDVVEELKPIARRLGQRKVVLLPAKGDPKDGTLADFLKKDSEDQLREATLVLPSDVGGLDRQGMLDGSAKDKVRDVADIPAAAHSDTDDAGTGELRRKRVLLRWNGDTETWEYREHAQANQWVSLAIPAFRAARAEARRRRPDMAEKQHIVLERDSEGAVTKALLLMTARDSLDAAEDTQAAADASPVELDRHNESVAREAHRITGKLGLAATLGNAVVEAVILAAERHDLGKGRAGWQKAIGNPRPPKDVSEWKFLAKSKQRGFDDSACGRYRHEFGSLREASVDTVIANHPERDLILHLIAAHHGWARPHFNEEHWDIEQGGYEENPDVAAQTPRRFARLQRRFGRWGLAFLESLLRAADYRVSSGKVAGEEKSGHPLKKERTAA